MIPATSEILAALKKCPHCPFLAKWSEHAEGIIRDHDFTEKDIDKWIGAKPWFCHDHLDEKACSGQAMFNAGKLDVTKEQLVEIWVNERSPDELV